MKDIAIGIAGAAGRGGTFISALQSNPDSQVAALCDINAEALAKAAAASGIGQTFTDFEKMLDSGIDAVVIGTPMHLHVPMSIAALERGIHVLSEVPAAISIEQCRDLVKAVKASRASYMMAENCCYLKSNVLVREMVKRGLFGQMYFAEGEYLHELKGLNEMTPWRRKWQTGVNGNTYPSHSLGPVLQWMGERVTSVCCVGSGHHYTDPSGATYEQEDTTVTMCRTSGGGLAIIRLDMLSNRPENQSYWSLQGTTGCFEAGRGPNDQAKIWLASKPECDHFNWLPLDSLQREFLPEKWLDQSEAAKASGHGGSDWMLAADWVETLASGRAPEIGVHEGLDMTLPGLVSTESINNGSVWTDVPDSRLW